MWTNLLTQIQSGNTKSLARCISYIENEVEGYADFLKKLPNSSTPVIGITGPPGAGKSTLVDALIGTFIKANKKVAVLCVDPSSPFNLGALLGDRIRMSQWYNEPNVFIRSLATRGALGGLHPKIIEITDTLKATNVDYIIVETVGVGQSEIEIAGLADITIVTIVPEAGDEIQTMKAGIMEIANMFVVNKADRQGADTFVKNLKLMLAPAFSNSTEEIMVLKTIASKNEGIVELKNAIDGYLLSNIINKRKQWLLIEKAYLLIQKEKMKDVHKSDIKNKLEGYDTQKNIFNFIEDFLRNNI